MGSALEACLTEWEPREDCAERELVCDSTKGECGAPCMPGSYRCNSAELEVCGAGGTWDPERTCETAALCHADPQEGSWIHTCEAPTCEPGQFRCNEVTPNELQVCNEGRNGFMLADTCLSAALCNAAAGRCDEPQCRPDMNMELPLRCAPGNPLQVERCKADFTGFEPLELCTAGEFCFPDDHGDPCKTECPKELLCNGTELLRCTQEGTVHQADCATATLCECAANDSCENGVDQNGCGLPLCGVGEDQCTGSVLERCSPGREAWQLETDCGSEDLCHPGTPPGYKDGYCAVCNLDGEIRCRTDHLGLHVCGPGGKAWVQERSCAGCLELPGSQPDYCPACEKNETRCNGTAPGSMLQSCSADQSTLVNGTACPYGCVDHGLNDACAVCMAGQEWRCSGTTLTHCNTDGSSLDFVQVCPSLCVDRDIYDLCGICRPGDKLCQGDNLSMCNSDGQFPAGPLCGNGCVPKDGKGDFCATLCRPGSYSCSGANLQICSTDGSSRTTSQACVDAAHCDANGHECDQCVSGEYSCSGTTLRSCDANGHFVTASSVCSGNTLRTCSGGTSTPTASTCTLCDATNKECDDCVASQTPYSCSQGTLRQCDGTGHWNSSAVPNCSGQSLRTCNNNTLVSTTCATGTMCDESANACYECTPASLGCSGAQPQVCSDMGVWTDSGAACSGTTPTCVAGLCQ